MGTKSIKNISVITPSRNNLVYLKWAYEAVRKYADSEIEYCVAADYCTDGTVEWCEETAKNDPYFKFIVNDGTWFGENKGKLDRMGHCRLYDKLILEVATNDIFVILHADMRISQNFFENMLKHIDMGIIVSGTRIEPSIHPKDLSKIQKDFGLEPDEFDDSLFQIFANEVAVKYKDKITPGFFAPWMAYRSDFESIGGHDQKTFGYQSREDSDIANRFVLNGYKLIQSRDSLCYHLTMRGSRRNPTLTNALKDSDEWTAHNEKSTRNFIRKWGHMIKVDEYMHPIVPHKYDIGFVIHNCTGQLLAALEPWASNIYSDTPNDERMSIINWFQGETQFNLSERLRDINEEPHNNIVVSFDGSQLTNERAQFLFQLPEIITDSGQIGKMEYDIFTLDIRSLETYEHNLIKLN